MFRPPLPTIISSGGGSGGGSSIVNNDSSVIVQPTSDGYNNIIITTENNTALTINENQNSLFGPSIPASVPSSRIVAKAQSNGNILTLVRDTNKTSTFSIDSNGVLFLNNRGNDFNISNGNINISNHNGSTNGLYLNNQLVQATASELNYVKTTPGSAQSLKAIILNNSKDINGINRLFASELSGTILTEAQPNIKTLYDININTKFSLFGTEVLVDANKLNYNNVTPGQAAVNKSLVLDSNKNINGINSLYTNNLYGSINTASQQLITEIGYLQFLNVEGNVGIGTQSPNTKLEIVSSSSPAVLRLKTFDQKTDLYTDFSGSFNINPQGTSVIFSNNKNLLLTGTGTIQTPNIISTSITGTIQTSSQPNITSIGTLTSLKINNQLLLGINDSTKKIEIRDNDGNFIKFSKTDSIFTEFNINSSGDFIINTSGNIALSANTNLRLNNGNVSGITNLTAINLSGTIQTSSQPNITSIGTLANLNVTNSITTSSVISSSISGIISTASQPNITSLGTLTNLSITGTLSVNAINSSQLSGTLQTASQPNITTIGTLSSLTITNGITANSINVTSISGTIQTSAQPNITSLGILSSLSVNGNITTTALSATTLSGTLSTESQPNIKSVGTLNNLSVLGNVLIGEALEASTLKGVIITSSQPNITSIGTLSSLTVSGTISSNSINSSSITGTLQTSLQPNVTSLGYLINLRTSGFVGIGTNSPNVPLDLITTNGDAIKITKDSLIASIKINTNGDLTVESTSTNKIVLSSGTDIIFSGGGGILGINSISASNISGTLQTTSQPLITSIGTLSNLDISGKLKLNTSSETHQLNIKNTSGNCIKLEGNTGLVTLNTNNGDLLISPSGNNIRLSENTNIILNGGTIIGFNGVDLTDLDATITKAEQPNITLLGELSELIVNGPVIFTDNSRYGFILYGNQKINGELDVTGVSTFSDNSIFNNGITVSTINSNTEILLNNDININGTLSINGEVIDFNNSNTPDITTGTVESNKLFVTDSNNNLSGINNLSSTTYSGSIQTSSQPNITSVGTLSALNVSGYLGIGTTSPSHQLECVNSSGNCLKIGNGTTNTIFSIDDTNGLVVTSSNNKIDMGESVIKMSKQSIGNTTNSTMPLEIGFTAFNFNQAYAYSNQFNARGTISAGSTFVYNYSIRALGRILCTQSIDVTSDRRVKNNIQNLTNDFCEEFINNTEPVKFKWNANKEDSQYSYGYIAQNLIRHGFLDFVGIEKDDTMEHNVDSDGVISPKGIKYNISYEYIIPILAKNQKKLLNENKELKTRLLNIENQLKEILLYINNNTNNRDIVDL